MLRAPRQQWHSRPANECRRPQAGGNGQRPSQLIRQPARSSRGVVERRMPRTSPLKALSLHTSFERGAETRLGRPLRGLGCWGTVYLWFRGLRPCHHRLSSYGTLRVPRSRIASSSARSAGGTNLAWGDRGACAEGTPGTRGTEFQARVAGDRGPRMWPTKTCTKTSPQGPAKPNQPASPKATSSVAARGTLPGGGWEVNCLGCAVVENTKSRTDAATKAARKPPV